MEAELQPLTLLLRRTVPVPVFPWLFVVLMSFAPSPPRLAHALYLFDKTHNTHTQSTGPLFRLHYTEKKGGFMLLERKAWKHSIFSA